MRARHGLRAIAEGFSHVQHWHSCTLHGYWHIPIVSILTVVHIETNKQTVKWTLHTTLYSEDTYTMRYKAK